MNTSNASNSSDSTIALRPGDILNSSSNNHNSNHSLNGTTKKRVLDEYNDLKIEKSMSNLVSGGEIQGKIIIGVYD